MDTCEELAASAGMARRQARNGRILLLYRRIGFRLVQPTRPEPGRPFYSTYFTDIVTPVWLIFVPTWTETGRSPERAVVGICTFTCMTPETMPGASP